MARSPREVIQDHLRLSQTGDFERDLRENYAEDVVVLTGFGVFRGHEGMRAAGEPLESLLHGAKFIYRTEVFEGPMGFLEWSAQTPSVRIHDGADSYYVADDKIHIQTIHYSIMEP